MTVYGKHGKTIKLFSHPSHRPWKSLKQRFPHSHRHDDYGEENFLNPQRPRGGPKQTAEMGQTSLPNATVGAGACRAMKRAFSCGLP